MCEVKTAGLVKSAQVFSVLPNAVFVLVDIAVIDPRLESIQPRHVYGLQMTREEWDKLSGAAYKRADTE